MSNDLLNKRLYTEVTRLRLCGKPDAPVRFLLEKSPFPDDPDDEDRFAELSKKKEHLIIGRILPTSEIFNQGSYQIEMKITSKFPAEPPEVRFLTPIYHPNVGRDGKNLLLNIQTDLSWRTLGQVCHELLKNTAKWTLNTYLVDVVKAIVNHIDHPDVDYAMSPGASLSLPEKESAVFLCLRLELGRQYVQNRDIFNEYAIDHVKKFAQPRF